MHCADVYARAREAGFQMIGEKVLPDTADHFHDDGIRAQFSRGDMPDWRLFLRDHLEAVTEYSFAGRR